MVQIVFFFFLTVIKTILYAVITKNPQKISIIVQ
jgi:hypothetical protein